MLHIVECKTVTENKDKGCVPVAGAAIQCHPRKSVVDTLEELETLPLGQAGPIHDNRLGQCSHLPSRIIVPEGRGMA